MREILFRAKRVKNNQWVEGSYHKHETRQVCPYGDKLSPDEIKHLIIRDTFADWNMPREIEATEVLPDTIGQYTGLTDKNGKRIFDGDIIEYFGEQYQVIWKNDEATFSIALGNNEYCYFDDLDSNLSAVIGNVYDNPEMQLEKEH